MSGNENKVSDLQRLLMEKVKSKIYLILSQDNMIENYLREMRNIKIHYEQRENGFNEQMFQEKKLSQMYKNSAKDFEMKAGEFSQLYHSLKAKYEQDIQELGQENVSVKELYEISQNELNELRTKVSEREQQFVDSKKEPMNQLQELFNKGLTATDIYNKYAQVSEDLIRERSENDRLNGVLNQILKEINEKAPLIQQQKDNYEKLMSSHAMLSKKYQKILQENEKKMKDFYNFRLHYDSISEENVNLKSENDELSSQVQVLLKECQEYKTGKKIFDLETTSSNSSLLMDTTVPIISDNFATFKDIQQLQINNRNLLKEMRKLTEEKNSEIEALKTQMGEEFKKQFETAIQEVDRLKSERKKESELVSSIIKQRDMYKEMSQEKKNSTPTQHENRFDISRSEEFKNLYEDFKKDRDLIQQQYYEQKKANHELKSELSKKISDIQFLQDSLTNAKMTLEPLKKEISSLKEKNDSLTNSNIQFQRLLEENKRVDSEKNQKISRLDQEITNKNSENRYLGERIERLAQDLIDRKKNSESQDKLYFGLQSIQSQLQTQAEKNERIANETIASLKEDVSKLKVNLENEKSLKEAKAIQLEINSKDFQEKMKTAYTEFESVKTELMKYKLTSESLNAECESLKQKLNIAETKLNAFIEKQMSSQNPKENDLQSENMKLQQDLSVVSELLKKEKEHSKNYKILSEKNEESLMNMNLAFDQYKKTNELKLKSKEESIESLKKDISQIREDMNDSFKENDSLKENIQKMKKEFEMEKFELVQKNKDLQETSQKSASRIGALQEDLRRYIDLWTSDNKEKESEVNKSAEALSQLRKLSETVEQSELELIKMKEKVQTKHKNPS
jgi:nucleoprotein TPR